jgi:hypothetical protein
LWIFANLDLPAPLPLQEKSSQVILKLCNYGFARATASLVEIYTGNCEALWLTICPRHRIWQWNSCNNISLPTSHSKHKVKNHYLSVNSNPTVSQQNKIWILDVTVAWFSTSQSGSNEDANAKNEFLFLRINL